MGLQYVQIRLLFAIFFWCCCQHASSQPDPKLTPDDLAKNLKATSQDTHRVKALLDMGGYYLFKKLELQADLDTAMPYLQQALSLSTRLADDKWKKESLWYIAYCYFEGKDTVNAMKTSTQLALLYGVTEGKKAEADTWAKMGSLILRHKDNFQSVIQCCKNARAIYDELGDKKRSIDMYKEIADMHLNEGKLAQSEEELLECIEMYKAIGSHNLHYTYDLLAAVCINRGNLNRALRYGLETIKSMRATQDTVFDHTFYYRLGNIYWQLDNMPEAISWYRKSLDNLPNKRYSIRTSVAQGMIRLGEANQAKTFLDTTMAQNPPMNQTDSAYMALAYGLCYNALGQFAKAERSFKESFRLHGLYNNINSTTSRINFEFGKFLVEQNRFSEAIPYLQTVLEISASLADVQRQRDIHALFIRVDSALGKYPQALYHFRQYQVLNDSIFTLEKNRQVEELQIQYQTEGKERDILFLQNEALLQASKLGQARLTKNLMIAGTGVLLFILALLWSRYRIKQRTNRMLEIQQLEINQTNSRLQQLLEEKELLMREIHHRVKNNLQIVMSLLNTQSSFLESGTALTAIRQSQQRIHSISLIHQKLYQSNSFTRIEMSGYIHELIDFLKDSFNTNQRITFVTHLDVVHLDVTQAVPLGLLLNEAISNALKYAFPDGRQGEITIRFHHVVEDQYSLSITDNGIGWPPGFDPLATNSLGMSLMKGLSKQLNGNFQIENGTGLSIRLVFKADDLKRDENQTDKIVSPESTPII
ncbi:MAG TPA: histidine kinase dimerization/phosphoacceptor domain -containing protein [Saprospiraceae bacterium]